MTKQPKETWYYVIVQNPGTGAEEIMGYEHEETGIPFIPAFASKEIAQQCFLLMPKDIMKEKYEPQAIIKEDLVLFAKEKEHGLFLLDDKGCIVEELS